MCGRAFIDEKTLARIMVDFPNEKLYEEIKKGELFPTDACLVYTKEGLRSMKWGINVDWSKQTIINARQETLLDKPFFRDDFMNNRCVIVVSGFYEWKPEGPKNKIKYKVKKSETDILYLAGFYKRVDEEDCFVIITQQATDDFMAIHNRLPLILEKDEVRAYVYNDSNKDWTKPKEPKLVFFPDEE